jgi:hypothetical protein
MTTSEKLIMWACAIVVACFTYIYIDLAISLSIKFGKVPTNFNGEMAQVLFAILFTIGLFLIPHFAIELAKKFLINEK